MIRDREIVRMQHVLIISDDPALSSAMEDRLLALGFRSFERSWTEEDAVDAARQRRPDLIVVGDSLAVGSPIETAARITEEQPDIPALLATTRVGPILRELPDGVRLDGPYPPEQAAVAVNRSRIRSVVAA